VGLKKGVVTLLGADVSVIIVNYFLEDLVVESVQSFCNDPLVAEIIVVDNGSNEGLEKRLRKFANLSVVVPGDNLGFAAGCNLGAQVATSQFLFFLNPDTKVTPGSIELLFQKAKLENGVVGPTVKLQVNESIDVGMTMNHLGMPCPVRAGDRPLYVSGSALFISRALFLEVGQFDERYFMFVEEVELCWRVLLKGYNVQVVRDACVLHVGGAAAIGGYASPGQPYTTSVFRVALRERNTIALMIACAPWFALLFVVPALVLRALAICVYGIVLGKAELVSAIWDGLVWNVHELRRSLGRRRSLDVPADRRRSVYRRLVRKPVMFAVLLHNHFGVVLND